MIKILTGAAVAAALLAAAPAVAQGGPKGVPNNLGYEVPHQKGGLTHPGGHSSFYGHKKNGRTGATTTHVHNGCHGHPPKVQGQCFPRGHCKSINQGYYGPPGQKGR